MTDARPAPLVAAEVDLSDFKYMELDVRRLRDSRFGAEVSGDAFRAGVMLWCASWHQVPAGSVPDDDIELANLAGYGRFVKEWRKIRPQALQGFVLCADGRLYHEVVAEKANAAWLSKLRHYYDKACERLRKANKARKEKGLDLIPEITFEVWNEQRTSAGLPMEKAEASAGIPQKAPEPNAGIPPENALRGRRNGEGEGEGDSLSEANASGADAPPPAPEPIPPKPPGSPPAPGPDPSAAPVDPREAIFAIGLPLLTQAGVSDKNARSFLGFLRKHNHDDAVLDALRRCGAEKALQPVEFLQGCLRTKGPNAAPAEAPWKAAKRAEVAAWGGGRVVALAPGAKTPETVDMEAPDAALRLG